MGERGLAGIACGECGRPVTAMDALSVNCGCTVAELGPAVS